MLKDCNLPAITVQLQQPQFCTDIQHIVDFDKNQRNSTQLVLAVANKIPQRRDVNASSIIYKIGV